MANIALSNDWPSGVYQYADGDVLDGGADSFEVLPLKQLANRSLYQRLASVTAWDAGLAAEFGYPAKACVMHSGQSWRAIVANSVAPGTDPAKWERWGYSESELESKISGLRIARAEDFLINTVCEIAQVVPGAQTLVGQPVVASSPIVTVINSTPRVLRYVFELLPHFGEVNFTTLGGWKFYHQLKINGVATGTIYSPYGQMNYAGSVSEVTGASGNVPIDSRVLAPGQSLTVQNVIGLVVSSALTTSALGMTVGGAVLMTRLTN